MAGDRLTVNVDAKKVLSDHSQVTITIDGYRAAILRLWLGCQVLKIARLIMGVPFDVRMAQKKEVPTSTAQAQQQDNQQGKAQ